MHVVLIQPLDPPQPVVPIDSAYGDSQRFAPAWDLLCLRAYLLARTRHTCSFIDCRLMGDLERELIPAVKDLPRPRLLMVWATTPGLGEAVAVIEMATRYIPDLQIALGGPFPAEFPEAACAVPHVDFVISGDAEPIVRNLIDFADNEQRLQRVPGLHRPGAAAPKPYWLDDLRSLSLPDWQGIFWPAYQHDRTRPGSWIDLRLSRGHSRSAADRAQGSRSEPLRAWPMDRVAACLQKCGHLGITEVFLNDPAGFWTPARLDDWCQNLLRQHNTQPWAFQAPVSTGLPAHAENLAGAGCRRLEWVFPSTDPQVARRFELDLNLPALQHAAALLQAVGIDVQLRFQLGGPEEPPGEAERVYRILEALRFPPFSVQPLLLHLDSPLAAEAPPREGQPDLDTWTAWARDPWTQTRPLPLWGGSEQSEVLGATLHDLKRMMTRSPRRLWRRAIELALHRPWLRKFEDWSVTTFHRLVPPRPGPN